MLHSLHGSLNVYMDLYIACRLPQATTCFSNTFLLDLYKSYGVLLFSFLGFGTFNNLDKKHVILGQDLDFLDIWKGNRGEH